MSPSGPVVSESRGGKTLAPSMAAAGNYARWLVSYLSPYLGKRVMEVGVGHGTFTELLRNDGHYLGVDVDDDLLAAIRHRFGSGAFVKADLTSPEFVEAVGGDAAWDTVLCVNVLEHLEDESRAVHNLWRACANGGHVVIFVPAFQALYNSLDALAGHYRRYTIESLRDVVRRERWDVLRLEYFNPVGALGWWAQRFVRHRDLCSPRVSMQVHAFDRVAVPISRCLNPLTRRIFGQSVLCVTRKTNQGSRS